ncbi:unnamed protein product, partial [Iphiclides podalirius]
MAYDDIQNKTDALQQLLPHKYFAWFYERSNPGLTQKDGNANHASFSLSLMEGAALRALASYIAGADAATLTERTTEAGQRVTAN